MAKTIRSVTLLHLCLAVMLGFLLVTASPASAALKIGGQKATPAAEAPAEEPADQPAEAPAAAEEPDAAEPAAAEEAMTSGDEGAMDEEAAAPEEGVEEPAAQSATEEAAEPDEEASPPQEEIYYDESSEAPEAMDVEEESLDGPGGPLLIDSEPQGAKVFIDGEEYGVTPILVEGLSPLPHEVVIYDDTLGAFSRKTETGSGSVFVDMTEQGATAGGEAGFIEVSTDPPNARVDIDGRNVGLTPIKVPATVGKHVMLLSRNGYHDLELSVTVTEGETQTISQAMQEKAGAILVIASPGGAEIFLDGASVGTASGPLRIDEVAPGRHEVRVEKEGYVTWKRDNVIVARESTETVLVALHPEHNETSVRVYSKPEGARVWLDGKEMGVSGPEGVGFVTTKGAHILRLEVNPAVMPGYRPLQISVSFTEDVVDFKEDPLKLPVIDESFIMAQKLFERGEGEEAISYLDRVDKEQASYPESRMMMVEVLQELGRVGEIPNEFEKLFDNPVYRKNPVLNLAMGYWAIQAANKSSGSEAVKYLTQGTEALDRTVEMIDYFPADERQAMALKAHYYTGIISELLFDLTGEKKHVKKGVQAWELFFGRMSAGEETLGDEWVDKAKRHQTNLLYLEKKLGG